MLLHYKRDAGFCLPLIAHVIAALSRLTIFTLYIYLSGRYCPLEKCINVSISNNYACKGVNTFLKLGWGQVVIQRAAPPVIEAPSCKGAFKNYVDKIMGGGGGQNMSLLSTLRV